MVRNQERLYGGDDDIDLTDTGLNLPATAAGGHFSGHGDWGGGDISGGDDDGGSKPMPGVPAPEAHDRNYFFPLPFNEEQIEIARRLEQSDGVVVQGPPGTGKTHTIANIICHYLATGRRVLVTAKTPEALTALQEKLPEGIRDLAIAVIHNDRQGARQLEQAVQVLANQAKQVNTRISTEEIRQKQARLAELQTSIAEIDAELGEIAHKNLSEFPVPVNRQKMMPIDVAKLVARDRNWHTWFPDTLSNGLQAKPRFTDSDVARVREIRQAFGPDLLYKTEDFPDPAALPDLAAVVAAHEELQRITRIEGEAAQGQIPYIAFTDQAGCDDARALLDFLDKVHEAFLHFERYHWLKAGYETLVGERDWEDESWSPLMEELTNWVRLTNRGRALSLKAIDTGEVDVPDAPVDRAIEDLCADKKPFGLFSLGKGGLKNQIERMTIEGRKPASCEDWQMIRDYRIWQREVVSFLGRWRGLSQGLDLMELPLTWTAGSEQMMQVGRAVEVVIAVGQAVPEHRQKAKLLFPYGVDITRALHQGEIDSLRHALKANLEREDLPGAQALKASIEAAIRNPRLPFDAVLRSFVDALGSEGTTPHEVAKAWRDILQESARLEALAPIRNELENLVRKIADSGAPKWAETLLAKVVGEEIDPWTPTDWRKTWFWAQANSYILSISDRARIAKLLGKRSDAEVEQKRLFTEVVQLRTFLAMKQNLTARVEAALGKFATAIARLGRGTGKAAARYRRIIRESTYETAEAVPCWILPEWRVCEQLPSELGTFELVIVDEASQSDITALPAILRGKKLLIVGDDKQVSPSAIGIEERQIIQLRATYLEGLPFADQMDPATSLYELGSIVFPGKAILLREHFRCVEPIIRFSSRFYPQPLIPLRLPTATERLDPPLIDIHVPHGVKDRDINLAEVEVVVAEIRAMTENPDFQNRTIGVISLIGNKQARKCYDRLVQELGAETMERHRIKCGNAATFQGQERDIMVLSMVACPATARAQTSRTFQQRFNVALSRARDRMVLVRSVTSSQLRPNDLKLDVIEHFRSPMGGGNISQSTDILDRCESDFEKDVCQRLLDYGYRIQPQVPVGARRIDVVVEGANDRRLAVELDGDKYHGPERWAEDVNRQRALERMGWIFWRCWGSNWAADPDGCFEELRATLHRLEIEPIGAKAVTDIRTEHRTAEPPTVPELPLEVIAPTADLHVEPYAIPRVEALYEDFADSIVPVEDGEAHEHAVEVDIGDLVVIRYNDAPDKPLRIRLSDRENRPDEGIVHIDEPLGKVLLGAGVDDEIELKIDGLTRIAVVEHIESHSAQAA